MAGSSSSDAETISDINIVPLVDIILVVLIIFMVTAPQVIRQQLEVQVPSGTASDPADDRPLEVFITEEGTVYVDQLEMSLGDGENHIRNTLKEKPELSAVISADRRADHGLVFEWLDLLKSAGVKAVSLASKKGDSQ